MKILAFWYSEERDHAIAVLEKTEPITLLAAWAGREGALQQASKLCREHEAWSVALVKPPNDMQCPYRQQLEHHIGPKITLISRPSDLKTQTLMEQTKLIYGPWASGLIASIGASIGQKKLHPAAHAIALGILAVERISEGQSTVFTTRPISNRRSRKRYSMQGRYRPNK